MESDDSSLGVARSPPLVFAVQRFANGKRRAQIADTVRNQQSRDVVGCKPRMIAHAATLAMANDRLLSGLATQHQKPPRRYAPVRRDLPVNFQPGRFDICGK